MVVAVDVASTVDGEHASGFATYDTARKTEVCWLEIAREKDVAPQSPDGLEYLKTIRAIARL